MRSKWGVLALWVTVQDEAHAEWPKRMAYWRTPTNIACTAGGGPQRLAAGWKSIARPTSYVGVSANMQII
eukprot:7345818-Pyramimonas_sp.AAC.1